jgi:hypothetical protein
VSGPTHTPHLDVASAATPVAPTPAPPDHDDARAPHPEIAAASADSAGQAGAIATAVRRHPTQLLSGQWGVAAVALAAGLLAWWFSDRHGLTMLYADARSHMTISRRLLDGPNHSLVQLGTVWLPLPHIVVAPFTLVTAWWRSGIAALPVNLACLVIEAIALFRVVRLASLSRVGAWIAVLVLLTNPGWLYLHTTSLGEPVLFAAVLVTIAGLSGWVRSDKPYSGGELTVFCGLPAAAAVLSRYDGWAIAAAGGVFVLVVAQLRWGQWRYSLRCLRGFAVAPLVAAAWWCWFNFVNWGDPLEFQRGRYSAQAQQDLLDRAGLLPDKGHLGRSVATYVQATLGGAGRWVLVGGLLGALAWLVIGRWRVRALAPWLLFAVPVGFYVLSLWTGQIALRLGSAEDPSMFNLRYGLQALPGLAAMVGLGAALIARGWSGPPRRWRSALALGLAAALLTVTTASWIRDWRSVPVVAEGLQQQELASASWAAAEYLHEQAVVGEPDGGWIMMDDSVTPMLPVVGADLDRVSAPFSGRRWTATLADPSRAEWLYVDRSGAGDAVARALDANPAAAAAFRPVFRDGQVEVLRRVGATP